MINRLLKQRFCLQQSRSPTYFNIAKQLQNNGIQYTRFNWLSSFNETNFQFNSSAAETLEFKHLLTQLVTQYCPDIIPETYCIHDQSWPLILNQLTEKYYLKHNLLSDQVDDLVWVLKPSMLNNGQHIKIFSHLSQLEQHFISSKRLGGEHVLQRYITRPHLLKGHKYSIRMFVVITNYAGAYLYPHGYFNVAQHPYQPHDFSDLHPHLTNEHLDENESNVIQIPTQKFDFFPEVFQQIQNIVTNTISGLKQLYPNAFYCEKQRALAIFGFDFCVDTDKRVWLLEANHGPCFPCSEAHPLQAFLYSNFWKALVSSFVQPIMMRQSIETIQYQLFIPIPIGNEDTGFE